MKSLNTLLKLRENSLNDAIKDFRVAQNESLIIINELKELLSRSNKEANYEADNPQLLFFLPQYQKFVESLKAKLNQSLTIAREKEQNFRVILLKKYSERNIIEKLIERERLKELKNLDVIEQKIIDESAISSFNLRK